MKELQSVQQSIPVRRGDVLRITSFSSVGNVTLSIVTRIWVNGTVKPGRETLITNNSRSAQSIDINLTDGNLIGLQVSVASGTVERGNIFIKAEVRQGISTGQIQLLIMSNYVTSGNAISYPYTPITSSIDGAGFLTSQTISTAAGGIIFLPTNTRWRLFHGSLGLITSAVAGNRGIYYAAQDGLAGIVMEKNARRLQVANENYRYEFGDYQEFTTGFDEGSGVFNFPVRVPEVRISSIGGLAFVTYVIWGWQAGDVNPFTFAYEEWLIA